MEATIIKASVHSETTITYYLFAIVGIRKADADWLVDEEDIRMLIPGVFETLC